MRKTITLYVPIIIIVLSILQGCSNSSQASTNMTTESSTQTPEEIIKLYIKGWADNDPASVSELFSDNGLYKDPSYSQGIRGEDLEQYVSYVWKRYEGQTFKSGEIKKTDDTHYTFEWWIENEKGIRSITGHDTVEIMDGKIVLLQGTF